MLNCFKDYKYIHILNHILDVAWPKVHEINSVTTMQVVCPTQTNWDNTMAADALVTLEAGASAGMVLTPKAGIFRLQHQKSYHIKAKQKYLPFGNQQVLFLVRVL